MNRIVALIGILFIALGTFSCGNGSKSSSVDWAVLENVEGEPVLKFIEDFYDFGTITQGEVVTYTFAFTNSGTAPLIIRDIIAGCGCTKSKVSKEVLMPGERATIDVAFNSKGWRGSQYKSVTLRTNDAISEKSVTIKANVVQKSRG